VCCVLHEVDIARGSFSRVVALSGGAVVADGPAASVLDADGIESIFLRRVAA
jgi:ABC-type phosphate/phosphonate transport system ATPase subunit